MAVEDMKAQLGDTKVEVLVADHQNKPDVGLTIVKRWFDVDRVDAVLDIANSAVALGVQSVIKEKNKIALYGIVGTTELTGKQCAKTGFSWVHDSVRAGLRSCPHPDQGRPRQLVLRGGRFRIRQEHGAGSRRI